MTIILGIIIYLLGVVTGVILLALCVAVKNSQHTDISAISDLDLL